jgi:serine/threonine protein kinase
VTRPELGQRFAHFHVYSLLGRGAMGVVFSAYNVRDDRAVALKLLPVNAAPDRTARTRFAREAELARGLRSAHAVPVLDSGEHDGELWLEMPLLPGEDLEKHLRRRGRLAPGLAVQLASDVAEALDAAHAVGLVHRDVKPANVLLVEDPVSGRALAFLADFGLTRPSAAAGADLTTVHEIVGTSRYMAPEQVRGLRLDGRADLYSLACVLFRCIAGRPPYEGSDAEQVREAHLLAPVPELVTLGVGAGPALSAAVARGMAKERGDRQATAGAFAAQCRSALEADLAGVRGRA